MIIDIKELMRVESGFYIMIADSQQTNFKDLEMAFEMLPKDIDIIVIPSLNPESIRFLKTEETIKIKGEK